MELESMNTLLFTNLQLLGMDILAMEGKYHVPFNKEMFTLPNKAGSEAVFHFLFNRLNPGLFKEQFRDCWPVLDRKAELQFRKICHTWLTSIQADDPDAHLPRINASLLLSPGGRKFVHLLYRFSTYVLTKTMTKEHVTVHSSCRLKKFGVGWGKPIGGVHRYTSFPGPAFTDC
ncbi:HAUS augmin-like complex subunit 6 [Plakobranchus ocellatus]|uniref:HAUS augmin-like complex subunit 6 n=1 Tax=Plakobranchus ocellatus TaxID=259542 RepID=A0AAV4C233_9GAST|nr:HAUS augmin-like complex subunit 6 [Plakobranchus ocellatus]